MSERDGWGDRLSSVVRDVRALGLGAPVRVGLEVSKRSGLHGALFGRLAAAPASDAAFSLPFRPPPIASISDTVRARTLREAGAIAGGTIELFGTALDLGPDPDWHATLDGPERWPALPWWQIDIRSSARLGDVKWVWELGRHRHLVVLARATALDPDGQWAACLEQQLTSWLDANPVEIGIHWYSNLEIALRAIAWVQILGLAGDRLPVALQRRMHAVLHHSGRHVLADVPYTVSTMRNNHLVGDALGLLVLGRSFPDDRRAKRWVAVGQRLFERQLAEQVKADGSMLEDSVSYHRFVLEMLAVRVLLGEVVDGSDGAPPSASSTALAQAAAFLVRLGALDGDVPRYGDGDEGRVLVATRAAHQPSDLAGSIHAALALAAPPDQPAEAHASWADDDEVAWYVPVAPTTDTTSPPATAAATAEVEGNAIGGGIARAERGPFTVWLKAGGDWSHGHADLCSTYVRADGAWLVGDPGTGTYNGPPEQRDYFRTSIAHPVLRLAGLDELEPHRAFRWRYPAVGSVGAPISIGDAVVLWGWHGSYRRLDPPRRIGRAVVLTSGSVTIIDWVEGPPGVPFALSLPLPPDATFDGTNLRTPSRQTLPLRFVTDPAAGAGVTMRAGQTDPFDGWWSPRYGTIEPSVRIELAGDLRGPVVWQLAAAPEAPSPTIDEDVVAIGELDVQLAFAPTSIELRCRPTRGDEPPATASILMP